MTAKTDLAELINQLTYLDHEHDTDIAHELTDMITHVKIEGLTKEEAIELFADRVKLLQVESVLENDEQLQLVELVLTKLPSLLFS